MYNRSLLNKLGALVITVACFHAPLLHAQYVDYQQALLNERVGFGSNTTGGAGGEEYWVTNLADDGWGSLREGVRGDTPRWIRFAVSGDFYPSYRVAVGSNKTIDARGAYVRIFSNGLEINGTGNIIIENVILKTGSRDGIEIKNGATNVWVDHCSFNAWNDEAMSIRTPSQYWYTDVTVSWCKFSHLNKAFLIGASDVYGQNTRVSLHHSWFDDTSARNPRVSKALVHAFNNLLTNWGSYGMASVEAGQLRTEGNIFHAGSSKAAVITAISGESYSRGYTNVANDAKLNGATISEYMPNLVFWPPNYYGYVVEGTTFGLRDRIIAGAGATR